MKGYIVLSLVALLLCYNSGFSQSGALLIYEDNGRRDPFFPLVDEQGRYLRTEATYYSERLQLSGILWDPQGASTAIINNQVLSVGESVSGFVVKEIAKNSVTVYDGKQELTIWLVTEQDLKDVQ